MQELNYCLECNPIYRETMIFLAADQTTADMLSSLGVRVTRIFKDAPDHVWFNTTHRMKHWMGLWALREYGEYLWVDWDTIMTREADGEFWSNCRQGGTPKFIRIPAYKHAVVNCGVLYVPGAWGERMETSFELGAHLTNDEHIWEKILPENVLERPEFWFGPEVQHVSGAQKTGRITSQLRFAHLGSGNFSVAHAIREAHKRAQQEAEAHHAH